MEPEPKDIVVINDINDHIKSSYEGSIVYDLSNGGYYTYNKSRWVHVSTESSFIDPRKIEAIDNILDNL